MTTTPAVDAVGLVKTFGSFHAVDGIDLEVLQGEIFGVLGPNGAGKTTTLRMLATMLPIDAGTARIFGVDVAREPHRVRQLLGVTGQYASVDENLPRVRTCGCSAGSRACGPRWRTPRPGGCSSSSALRRPRRTDRAVLRRHAPPARPGGQPDHAATADLP